VLTFSIIIPVFNTSQFLDRCIESCINQSYKNIEIICVDDGSTDNSKDILLSHQRRDKRIHCFFHQQNASQYMARRTGIEHASGDYILFLDSDDTLRSDACSLLAKKIEKETADIIQFGYKEVPSNKIIFLPFYKTSRERIAAYLAKANRCSPAVWTNAYRRAIIIEAYNSMEVFYASGSEDLYTSLVIAHHAKTFSLLKKTLVNYSINTGWSTRQVFSIDTYRAWLKSYQAVVRKIKNFVGANIPEFVPQCLGMETYLLKDFIFCRITSALPSEIRHAVLDLLPDFFSKEAYNLFYDELLQRYNEYETYLNYAVSFRSRTKKMIKTILRYFESFFIDNGSLYGE
jgi:glycosyltransferase involved in cell wall biosynthesis